MPQLAPKRWCFDCGKYVGRRWQEIVRCGSCMDKLNIELGLKDKPKDPRSEDIPY